MSAQMVSICGKFHSGCRNAKPKTSKVQISRFLKRKTLKIHILNSQSQQKIVALQFN